MSQADEMDRRRSTRGARAGRKNEPPEFTVSVEEGDVRILSVELVHNTPDVKILRIRSAAQAYEVVGIEYGQNITLRSDRVDDLVSRLTRISFEFDRGGDDWGTSAMDAWVLGETDIAIWRDRKDDRTVIWEAAK